MVSASYSSLARSICGFLVSVFFLDFYLPKFLFPFLVRLLEETNSLETQLVKKINEVLMIVKDDLTCAERVEVMKLLITSKHATVYKINAVTMLHKLNQYQSELQKYLPPDLINITLKYC